MEQEKKKKNGLFKKFVKCATIVGGAAIVGYLWGNPKSNEAITKGAKAVGNRVKGWASSRKKENNNSNAERRNFDQQPRERFRGQQNQNVNRN